jgi:tRNA pseudouridine38-40 synthase
MTRRMAAKIAYLGAGFNGSQRQVGQRTVEGEVLRTLTIISGMPEEWFNLKSASRTDTGVNSLGNVMAFNTNFQNDEVLLKALNAVSKGVYFRGITRVPEGFNPRIADERSYRYILPAKGIDLELFNECAQLFVGEHDYKRFCRSDGKPTTGEIRSISVVADGDNLIVEFRALFYLWNLIRRIIAASSGVGCGAVDIEDVKRALDGEDMSFGLARADALTLTDVSYEGIVFKGQEGAFDRLCTEEQFRLSLRADFFRTLQL